MRTNKNKIVFFSVVGIIILFIVAYGAMLMSKEQEGNQELEQPQVPALQEEQESYSSRIEALEALREVRRFEPPSIYSESLLDSLGVYDPSLEQQHREQVVDSIYQHGPLGRHGEIPVEEVESTQEPPKALVEEPVFAEPPVVSSQDFIPQHQEFFRPRAHSEAEEVIPLDTDSQIHVRVSGQQQVRMNDRLELMLSQKALIDGVEYPKNTRLYGFVRLQPNRVHIEISHLQGRPIKLRAFDLQDSREGIYMRNSFRAELGNQVLGDVIQDINIAGVPQVRGIKSIFARQNRSIKITILDQYQLILKPGS